MQRLEVGKECLLQCRVRGGEGLEDLAVEVQDLRDVC